MSFLSRIFGEKEEQISLDSARELFNKLKRQRLEGVEEEKARLMADYKQALAGIRAAIEELKKAQLLNKNISQREIAIMEGNRSAYANQVGLLLSSLKPDIFEAAPTFEEQLNRFLKSSLKPYQVLTFFLETEAAKVARSLKRLEQVFIQVRNAAGEIANIETVEKSFENLDRAKSTGREIEIRKKQLSNELKEIEARKDAIASEKIVLSGKLEKLKARVRKAEQYKGEAEHDLHQMLAQFSKLFRKYYNLKGDKLSHALVESPIEATRSNPEGVAKLLKELQGFLMTGDIGEKEQERSKLQARLEPINQNSIVIMVEALGKAEADVNRLRTEIESSNEALALKRIEHEDEGLVLKVRALNAELAGLKPASDACEIKQEIGHGLSGLSGRNIRVL